MNNHLVKIKNPRRIRLEASTACQLKCPTCPTASGKTGENLGVGFLKFDDFKKLVDQNPQVSHIELSNWGEIFLNKEIGNIIKYAYKKNVVLAAHNGANLNNVKKDVLQALVKYQFRYITCSIDGASQETYSIYRVGGNFEQVIENIKIINKFKAQYNSTYPALKWQFVAFGHNEHEIPKARRMAVDLNMEFHCKLSWEDLYDQGNFAPVRDQELIKRETGSGAANRQEFREKNKEEYALKGCCLELWRKPQINFDGKVLGCSVNYWGDYGNAFEEGLEKSINNEKIVYAREMLLGKARAKEGIPCTTCKVYKFMNENDTWMTEQDIKGTYAPSRTFIMFENKILGKDKTKQLAKTWANAKKRLKGDFQKKDQGGEKFKPLLSSGIYPITLPLEPDELKGWKPYPIFRGVTKGIKDLSCHISSLTKDRCPHLPHGHKEEELLLVLSGEVELIIPKEDLLGENLRIPLKAGEFVYYPAFFYHTLQTTSEQAANYLMFKWHCSKKTQRPSLFFKRHKMFETINDSELKEGFQPRLVFEGKTSALKKLHCHTSTLSPGAGYEPHIDPYDVAIIVLEGEVETLEKRAKAHDVIFYASGEPHGMHNPGDNTAKYIVFEFHS